MRRTSKALALIGTIFLLGAPAPAAAAMQPRPEAASAPALDGRRVALIIGNSDYADETGWTDLPNAANDAAHIGRLLASAERGGFEVEVVTDGTRERILAALEAFAGRAAQAEVALVYFSGHGFEYNLDNYIVPVDAPGRVDEGNLPRLYINMSQVVRAAEARGMSLFFLDACRDPGPVLRFSNSTGGDRAALFGAIHAPQSAVFYATAMGDVAYDAAPPGSPLSPFAQAVGRGITEPGLDLPYVFSTVREQVVSATRSQGRPQIPQFAGSWSRPFYFTPPISAAAATARAVPVAAARLDIPLATLSTLDEPILITRVLDDHSPSELIGMAEAGDPLALYLVGYMFEFGVGVERDLEQARRWLERAAESGHPAGQLELGYFLMMNDRSAEGRARALQLLREASAQGYAKAKSHLAAALMSGTLGTVDQAEGRRLYREAAALGHANAHYALAVLGERERSVAALEALAQAGNDEGHNWLCELGAAAVSVNAPFRHCLAAARAGYANARGHAALLYAAGNGVEASPSDARYWARLALPAHDLSPALRARLTPLAE